MTNFQEQWFQILLHLDKYLLSIITTTCNEEGKNLSSISDSKVLRHNTDENVRFKFTYIVTMYMHKACNTYKVLNTGILLTMHQVVNKTDLGSIRIKLNFIFRYSGRCFVDDMEKYLSRNN